jgi:hypothetical protein
MNRDTRVRGRILRSTHGVILFATVIFVIAVIDVMTRPFIDAFTRAKLLAWLSGAALVTFRIVRVLRKIEASGAEWSDAERMLFQLAPMIPIAGIIPLAFL